MAKDLDQMSNQELADELADLDSVIEADQQVIADARKRLKLHARMREDILNYLALGAMRKGWS